MISFRRVGEVRASIERVGGLFNRAGLARRWGVSRQYVGKATAHPDFPPAIQIGGGGEVWPADEADDWRKRHRPRNE